MEAIAITSTPREGRGKGDNRKLRAQGRIPAVAYGHGIEGAMALTLDPRELEKALQNPKGSNAIFSLDTGDGQTRPVLVRELQRHPVSRKVLHVDLVAPDLEREIVTIVPVRFTGRSVGVQAGGRMRTPYREVRLRGKPANIPAEVLIDITPLDQGDAVMASQMPLPEGVQPVFDRDFIVVKIIAPRGRKAEGEEKAAGKKKK